jgi:glycosyltransferase involved in cell wall biosynthesis
MVTTDYRREHIPRAIGCFLSQTHPDRELIMVSEDWVRDLLPGGTRLKFVQCSSGLTIGEKRNIAVAHCTGEFVATWDDDDWSHPERLAVQVTAMAEHPEADAIIMSRATLVCPQKQLYGISSQGSWHASMMARRWKLPCFPAQNLGEDMAVISRLKVCLLDRPDLFHYLIHGGNTFWTEENFKKFFAYATPCEKPAWVR